MTARVKIRVTGVVQGVGYRYYTYRIARGLDLKGYVRNQKDGSVEVLAEGEKGKLMDLISELRIGPPNSKVDNLSIEWQESRNEFSDFKILK
ncbi:MAG: acylphosphatase [Candidatus Methanosuratincola verstraetei]|uniref:acylphosphatase n=1 Tax=Methanosuratincola subterraneus TaxID=2593994 RepID=A0A444L5T2_METS7|nr:MAG: acylphosphatase [Candidatus Methanosuratincola subterraneus]